MICQAAAARVQLLAGAGGRRAAGTHNPLGPGVVRWYTVPLPTQHDAPSGTCARTPTPEVTEELVYEYSFQGISTIVNKLSD